MKCSAVILLLSIFFGSAALAQESIFSKEGRRILNRRELVYDCLRSLNKDRSDKIALGICECQASVLDGRFSNKQFKQFTKKQVVDLTGLIESDSLVKKELQECYTASGQTVLLQAESSESEFLKGCRTSIQNSSDKTLDPAQVDRFCQCQLQLVKTKRLSDQEMASLSDPNSLLFFEIMYRCGSPFLSKEKTTPPWSAAAANDISGPATDTIDVLVINGMTYLKVKIGSLVQVWLFDTGASDLLINTEMEAALKKENILTAANYLGVGEYELANGAIDSCRRYRVKGVQVGRFTLENIVISVSEKGKRIIVGKTLLNKFRHWTLNNQENKLVLVK